MGYLAPSPYICLEVPIYTCHVSLQNLITQIFADLDGPFQASVIATCQFEVLASGFRVQDAGLGGVCFRVWG